MKSSPKTSQYIIFICVFVISITTILGGIKYHETWRIVIGSISLMLITAAVILNFIKYRKEKKLS